MARVRISPPQQGADLDVLPQLQTPSVDPPDNPPEPALAVEPPPAPAAPAIVRPLRQVRPFKSCRRKLPKPPGALVTGEQFCAYTALLTPEDWAHLLGYVYRIWPVLSDDRDPKYLQKISEPITEEDLLREHGSGDYALMLNDSEVQGSQNRTICRVKKWSLRDPNRPPIIPDLRHINRSDPANREYVNSLIRGGKLTPDGNIPPPPAAAGNDPNLTNALSRTLERLLSAQLENRPAKSTDADALSRVMEMLQKGHEQSITMLKGSMQQQDPGAMLAFITALKDLMPKPEPATNPLTALKEVANALRELAPATTPQQNPVAQLRELFQVANEFRDLAGAAEPARATKTHWSDYIPYAISSLGQIAQSLMNRPAAAGPRAGYAMGPVTPGAPHQADIPAPPAIAAAAGADSMPPQPNPAAQDPAVQQLASFLPMIGGPLVNFLNAGRSGADFADYLAEGYGAIVTQQIAQLSATQIRAALELDPQLSSIVRAMPAAVDQFIAEFLAPPEAPTTEEENLLQ